MFFCKLLECDIRLAIPFLFPFVVIFSVVFSQQLFFFPFPLSRELTCIRAPIASLFSIPVSAPTACARESERRPTAQGEANPTLCPSSGRSFATIPSLYPRRESSVAILRLVMPAPMITASYGMFCDMIDLWKISKKVLPELLVGYTTTKARPSRVDLRYSRQFAKREDEKASRMT